MSDQLVEVLENKASSERVQELILLCPEAVKEQNEKGKLPIHEALVNMASDDVITMLFKAYPKAAEV